MGSLIFDFSRVKKEKTKVEEHARIEVKMITVSSVRSAVMTCTCQASEQKTEQTMDEQREN